MTGEPWAYSHWSSGEPNNYGGSEDVAMVYRLDPPDSDSGTWCDLSRDSLSVGTVIEYEPYESEPGPDDVGTKPGGKIWHVVADAGSDGAGDGSSDRPVASIGRALEEAVSRDTVQVAAGLYPENVGLRQGVALIGAGARVCEIRGQHSDAYVVFGARDAAVRGFTIRQAQGARRSAIFIRTGGMTVADNIILNGHAGVDINGGAVVGSMGKAITVARNIISDSATGIYWSGASLESVTYKVGVRILNNIIHNVAWQGVSLGRIGGYLANNTVYLNKPAAPDSTWPTVVFTHGASLGLHNNILVSLNRNSPESAVWITPGHKALVLDAAYNNAPGGYHGAPGIDRGESDIAVDPLFVNVGKGDFRLRPDSPCRDAGNPDPIWNDLDGSRNDMGAYGGPDPIRFGPLHPKINAGIGPVTGAAGDTVRVPVYLDNAAGLAVFAVGFAYRPELLVPIGARTTEVTEGFSLTHDFGDRGTGRLVLNGSAEIDEGEGAIAEILFAVSGSAAPGDACALELSEIMVEDGAGDPIEIKQLTDGAFAVIGEGPPSD